MRCAGFEIALSPFLKMVSRIVNLLCLVIALNACAATAMDMPLPSSKSDIATPLPPATPFLRLIAQIPEQWSLVLEWPERIRVGDSDLILLTLKIDPEENITPTAMTQEQRKQGERISVSNLYETHFVFAEGRLDISGLDVKPNPVIREPLHQGQSVKLAWSVRPDQAGVYRGMVWLHLTFKPKEGGTEERLIISAQRIDIHAVNLLGLSGNAARWLGAFGALLGVLLIFDSITALFGKLWNRK